MKRLATLSSLLAVLLVASAARAQADPVAANARASTNLIIVIDISQIDLDKLVEYGIAKAKGAGVAQADIDQGMKEIKPQLDEAKGGLAAFKEAGVSKVYGLLNAAGFGTGEFGVVVIPTTSAQNGQKVLEMLQKMVNPENDANSPIKVSLNGSTVMLGSKAALGEKPQANAALAKALAQAGGGAPAALRVALDLKSIPGMDSASPEDKQLLQNVEAATLSVNVPPNTTFALSVQCKDADTAKKVAAKYTEKLNEGRNDPEAKKALGDTTALYNALSAKVQGTTVSVSLDTKQIEEIVLPAIAKAAAHESKGQGADVKPPQK